MYKVPKPWDVIPNPENAMHRVLVAVAPRVGLVAVIVMIMIGYVLNRRAGPSIARVEVAGIRLHLLGAERLMLSDSVDRLSSAQRAARERALESLRLYTARGMFPHNHRVVGRRSPVFVDEHGTRCAMAYLIERSGDAALVKRIATTHNLATIHELQNDPDLVGWLDRNGMTVAEAARVQPQYGYYPDAQHEDTFKIGQAVVGGFALLGAGLNVNDGSSNTSRQIRGSVGIVLGLTSIGVGVAGLYRDDSSNALTIADLGLGALSFGLGARQLAHVTAPVASVTWSTWLTANGTPRMGLYARF